jgi:phytoene synthase
MDAHQKHAMEIVRQGDHDRYLSVLYATEAKRGSLFALYAFNVEIARIRDVIRQPMAGELRLQWWRDVLANPNQEAAQGHPVASALVSAIKENSLPLAAFQNYLDARIFDLYDDPMPSRTDLEGYCGETASALIQLAGLVLAPEMAVKQAALAGHAGCAQAITGLLRLLPIHRARGQCFVPAEILASAGTTPEEFVAGSDTGSAVRAVAATIALAREHLASFRQQAAGLPAELRPAFLPLAVTGAYLDRLASRIKAFDEVTDISAVRKHWLMMRRATGGWNRPALTRRASRR